MRRFFTLILTQSLGVSIGWTPAGVGQPQSIARIGAWNQQRSGNLLDGFSISRAHTIDWTVSIRIQQLQALMPNMWCAKYKATVSDHLPLVARFRVSSPDDD